MAVVIPGRVQQWMSQDFLSSPGTHGTPETWDMAVVIPGRVQRWMSQDVLSSPGTHGTAFPNGKEEKTISIYHSQELNRTNEG